MKKRILPILLVMAMLIGCFTAIPAIAATYENTVDMSAATTVEAGKVYAISDVAGLTNFQALSASSNFAGATVILTKDIQLNEGWDADATGMTAPSTLWTPISTFAGTFDGQTYSISGLYNVTATVNGLFASLTGAATVKNLTVKNSYFCVTGTSGGVLVGTVTADIADGAVTIDNVTVDTDVILATQTTTIGTKDGIGGLVGKNSKALTIQNSTNNADIKPVGAMNASPVGGILGYAGAQTTLIDCTNNGAVTSEIFKAFVGGIIGSTFDGTVKVTMQGCVNNGAVTGARMKSGDGDRGRVGGLIARIPNAGTFEFTNCLNTGKITGDSVGGMIGHTNSDVTMTGCVNKGAVDVLLYTDRYNYAGGFIGQSKGGTFTDCINMGKLTDSDTTLNSGNYFKTHVGGFIGQTENPATFIRCADFGTYELNCVTASNAGWTGVGGFVGRNNQKITFTDCAYYGTAAVGTSNAGADFGGFIGVANGEYTLTNCISAGVGTTKGYLGAFVGRTQGKTNTWTNCFYQGISKAAGNGTTQSNPATKVALNDLNAVKNLPKAFTWGKEATQYKLANYNGAYLPMLNSVAKVVEGDKAAKTNGVDYHAVQSTAKNGDTFDVRFVSTVDDLQRDKIGFEVTLIHNGQYMNATLEDGTVYEKLTYGDLTSGKTETNYFSVEGKYLGAMVFKNVPAEGTVTFQVTAFSTTDDVTSYDNAYIVVFVDGVYVCSYLK